MFVFQWTLNDWWEFKKQFVKWTLHLWVLSSLTVFHSCPRTCNPNLVLRTILAPQSRAEPTLHIAEQYTSALTLWWLRLPTFTAGHSLLPALCELTHTHAAPSSLALEVWIRQEERTQTVCPPRVYLSTLILLTFQRNHCPLPNSGQCHKTHSQKKPLWKVLPIFSK